MQIKISCMILAMAFALTSARAFALSDVEQQKQYTEGRVEALSIVGSSFITLALFEKFVRITVSLMDNPYGKRDEIASFSDFCRQLIPSKSTMLLISGLLLSLNGESICQLLDLLAEKAESKVRAALS